MKRKHLNLLLGAAVLVLAPTVWFSREKPEPAKPPITSLKGDAVQSIVLQHPGKGDIELKREGGEWRLTQPVTTRAEPLEVNGILGLADAEAQASYPIDEVKPAELGLDKPFRTVKLNDTAIEFGELDPIESRRYVRVGDKVHLIADPPSAALDADYADLVGKRLIPPGAKINAIRLKKFKLVRTEKDGWQVEPKSADQGADAAQQLVNAWQDVQSMWNTSSEETLAAETATVVTDQETLTFTVIDTKNQLVLGRPDLGIRFTLPKTQVEPMFTLKAPEKPEARDAKPAEATPEEKPEQ